MSAKRLIEIVPGWIRHGCRKLEVSPLARRLIHGTFWSLIGAAVGRGLALVSSIVLARILGLTIFGELGIVQSTVGTLGTFAGLGMGLTTTKYVAEFRTKDRDKAARIIGLSGLIAWACGSAMMVLLFLSAPWLAEHTLGAPHLASILQMSSPLLLAGAVVGVRVGALSGLEAFKRLARINLVAGAWSFPILLCATAAFGLPGAVWGLVAGQALLSALTYGGLRAEARQAGFPLNYRGWTKELPIVWRFAVPALFSSALIGPVGWVCHAILVNQPDGFGQMGQFNAANQWFNALLFLPGILGQAALPVLTERFGVGDARRSTAILGICIKANAMIVGPLVLIGALASPYIMALYGPSFRAAWPTLVVALATAGLLAIQTPVAQIIAASGRMWLGTVMNLGWAISFVLLTWLLVDWGSVGLAIARLLAYVVHGIWTLSFVLHLLRTVDRQSPAAPSEIAVSSLPLKPI